METLMRVRRLKRLQQRRISLQRRHLRDASDPLDIPEDEFIQRYRLNHNLFLNLCNLLHPIIGTEIRSSSIPYELKILSTLSFLATGSYQRVIGNDFAISISQPSVSRYFNVVINGLNHVMNDYIKFPSTIYERNQIKQGFYTKFGVPGVIGCIDGTHIAIVPPRNHPSEATFYCRKGYHSINATLICDSDLKIIGLSAKFGGASHDGHVWRSMALSSYVEELYSREQGWLMGDSGYSQRPWLMIPILDEIEGTPEAYYTNKHILVRNCIERCIGVLKARWRCLLKHRVQHYDPDVCGKIINACAILHNMCVTANLGDPEPEIDIQNEQVQINVQETDDEAGNNVRNALIHTLWASRGQ